MGNRIALCVDELAFRNPETMGLDGESLENQEWLDVFVDGGEARRSIGRSESVERVWVASCEDVEPINLAATLKEDKPGLAVYLVVQRGNGSLFSRAHAACIDGVIERGPFLRRYAEAKARMLAEGGLLEGSASEGVQGEGRGSGEGDAVENVGSGGAGEGLGDDSAGDGNGNGDAGEVGSEGAEGGACEGGSVANTTDKAAVDELVSGKDDAGEEAVGEADVGEETPGDALANNGNPKANPLRLPAVLQSTGILTLHSPVDGSIPFAPVAAASTSQTLATAAPASRPQAAPTTATPTVRPQASPTTATPTAQPPTPQPQAAPLAQAPLARVEKLVSTRTRGCIVPVVSGSGGAGKSTVSVLAAFLARERGYRTLLLDYDLQFGDAALMAGVGDPLAIDEAMARPERFERELVHASGLVVLAAPDRLEKADVVVRETPDFLDSVMDRFDVIIANTGAAWAEQHAVLLERSYAALFLIDQRASSIRACRHALELCTRCGIATGPFEFALNRCAKGAPLTPADVSCALQDAPVLELKEGGRDVEDYLGAGAVQELVQSGNELCESMRQVLDRILPNLPEASSPDPGEDVKRARKASRKRPRRLGRKRGRRSR